MTQDTQAASPDTAIPDCCAPGRAAFAPPAIAAAADHAETDRG